MEMPRQPPVPMGMAVPLPPPPVEESVAKRPRIEQGEGEFIPEQQFIASHPVRHAVDS